MALDLVKGFSNKSWVSKRLWKTIKGLKEVGPKLGLQDPTQEDPHSSAALAMAGLAGHEISGLANTFDGHGQAINRSAGMGTSPLNGNQMSYEMTHLFEAALGTVGIGNGVGNGYHGMGAASDGGDLTGVSNVFGGEDELYKQLKDLF